MRLRDGIILDYFAGGGGASEGIRLATGRDPDIAINHDPEAIALHAANHPGTEHLTDSVWNVDPVKVCRGRHVRLAWFSPDCKHFSKAKGGKPVNKKIRGLAWVVVRVAASVRPDIIAIENVEEFQTWGPLDERGFPCPRRSGQTFRAFVRKLEKLGYTVQWRELRACDYGAPTIRKRLFLVARCDGQPIVWPTPTHGKGRPFAWRSAAECIDWSVPCPSIFLTKEEGRAINAKRPLAEATLRRIARGLKRYVLDNPRPFIVGVGGRMGQSPERGVEQPFQTITAKADSAIIAPYLVPRYNEREGQKPRCQPVTAPLSTVVPTANGAQLVAAFMAQHNTKMVGHHMTEPVSTIVGKGCTQALVTSYLAKLYGTSKDGQQLGLPLPTVTAGGNHIAEVRAFLVAYFGNEKDGGDLFSPVRTVTTRDRFGLVTVNGSPYQIVDIGMRMLTPRELYRAQGFPEEYRIDVEYNGKPLTKSAQVRMCGNSVCPPVAAAIVRANLGVAVEAPAAA